MKTDNCRKTEFLKATEGKKIICYGASVLLQKEYEKEAEWYDTWRHRIAYFVDHSKEKQENGYVFGEDSYEVLDPKQLRNEKNCIVLITTNVYVAMDIFKELEIKELDDSIKLFFLPLILKTKSFDDAKVEKLFEEELAAVNRKIIHSFWFSGEPIPGNYQRCVDSWKKFCPDYDIRIWNASTYDVQKSKYMEQAYNAKKWAFVSDYARLDVIYQYGGIYLDMDVEVIRPLDKLLRFNSFFGIDEWGNVDLGTGFGAIAGNAFVGELLKCYDNRSFVRNDGTYDITAQPVLLAGEFERYGFKSIGDSQRIGETVLLSTDYLEVYSGKRIPANRKTGKEFLIHWRNAGWWNSEQRDARYNMTHKALEELEEKCLK